MSAGKTSMPQEFKQIADIGRTLIRQTQKPRKELLSQMTEALRTGGVKAKIPLIQQAVSQQKQALGGALTSTAEQLASKNIGGPFAQRALAGMRLAGEQNIAGIPTQMAEGLIKQTMPFLSNTQSLGMGGISQAGQASFAADAFNAQQFAKLMGDIRESLMGAGQMAGGCLHPDCRIETPDGAIRVEDIRPGATVWSRGARGARVPARVLRTVARYVGAQWAQLKLQAPGGAFIVSPTHPLPDGTLIERRYGGEYVVGATSYTYDIEVDGPTGVYYVNGFELGSTLDGRHAVQQAA